MASKSNPLPPEAKPATHKPQDAYAAEHPLPTHRLLRGFSFDPSLSGKVDTAAINERVYAVPWEDLKPGPQGEYVEIVDVDPPSDAWYAPVDLNVPHLLAQNGLAPSIKNPQFHQQMVYAVIMTTIKNFERALGRPVMWSDRMPGYHYVPKLRVYPHALREANAYYSPDKKALLFGYFPTSMEDESGTYPGGMIFSCLSHDIIAHETTHAILDGIYPKFMEVTQPDGLAFHEAFADIVALFQHFTFQDVVEHQIAKTRGNLEMNNLLGQLAQEFGAATGNRGSLRDALGSVDKESNTWKRKTPDPNKLKEEMGPHERGSILVSAVFDAFIIIYNAKIADLRRIASGGTGILAAGELHPDLVHRLASEAVKVAQRILYICIRALDYCPPTDIDFGDYLRAIITSDRDVVPEDARSYRLAFIDAFRQHGIYPKGLRGLSEESLTWDTMDRFLAQHSVLRELISSLQGDWERVMLSETREQTWKLNAWKRSQLHTKLSLLFNKLLKEEGRDEIDELQRHTGLDFGIRNGEGGVKFEVHSLWLLQRQRPEGDVLNHAVLSIIQHTTLKHEETGTAVKVWGGCNIIFDLRSRKIKFIIRKPLYDQLGEFGRLTRAREYLFDSDTLSLAETYGFHSEDEPFAFLHTHC